MLGVESNHSSAVCHMNFSDSRFDCSQTYGVHHFAQSHRCHVCFMYSLLVCSNWLGQGKYSGSSRLPSTTGRSLILDWTIFLIADASKSFGSPIDLPSVHASHRLLISGQVPRSTRLGLMPLHIGTSIAPCLCIRSTKLSLLQCLRCPNIWHASIACWNKKHLCLSCYQVLCNICDDSTTHARTYVLVTLYFLVATHGHLPGSNKTRWYAASTYTARRRRAFSLYSWEDAQTRG